MFQHFVPLAAALLAVATAAAAIDLDGLSTADRRVYCFAYVAMDLEMREEAGLVDGAQVQRESNRMVGTIYGREGKINEGAYRQRLTRAVSNIAKEDPSPAAFAAQVKICRKLFGL